MKKFFTLIIVLSISFFLLIEFIGDRLIKNILEDNVSSSLGRKVTIEKLNIDYLRGAADAKGINLLKKICVSRVALLYTLITILLCSPVAQR